MKNSGAETLHSSLDRQLAKDIRDVGLALLDRAFQTGATRKRGPYLRTVGQAFAKIGRNEDAEWLYSRLAEEPGAKAEALLYIADLRRRTGRHEEALRLLEQSLASNPGIWQTYNTKGITLAALNRFDEAIETYRQGLQLNSQAGEIHNNLATALRSIGRPEEALPHCRQAMAILPDTRSVHMNTASALEETGDTNGALREFETLISRNPDYVDAHHNRAQILLSLGRFEEGWSEFKWRMNRSAANVRHDMFPHRTWSGENIDGKNVLVWTEQGIGDEILAASMIPDLAQKAGRVTLLCSERLIPVMRRSFPEIVVEHRSEPLPASATDPSIDLQMSLSELGAAFRRSFADFPTRQSFFRPDENYRKALRRKYQSHRPGTKLVGISWMSQRNYEIGWLKSQNLLGWAEILSVPGVTFVNLQYGDRRQDLDAVRDKLGVEVFQDTEIDPLANMDGFAAQVAAMDLVISVSNTTVHTAGALGIPTWALLAEGRGRIWYWFRDRPDSPWYPSLRLLRQEKPGDWAPVLGRCAEELTAWSDGQS